MKTVLSVNYGDYDFCDFNEAIETLEEEFGYEGWAWHGVIQQHSFAALAEFLEDDGLYVVYYEENDI